MSNFLGLSTSKQSESSRAARLQFRDEFLKKLDSLDAIQPLSTSALRLMQVCRDPNQNINELVDLVFEWFGYNQTFDIETSVYPQARAA